MTRVTLEMPAEAVRKLMENPEAAIEYLRRQGIDAIAFEPLEPEQRTLAEAIGMEVGQAFTWESPDGMTVTWSIDLAKKIIGERPPDPRAALSPDLVVHALRCNSLAHDIDKEYALATDLSKPLIATVSPQETREGCLVLIIIDGWHRILKAFLTNHQQDLQVHVLTPDEEAACRIQRIQSAM